MTKRLKDQSSTLVTKILIIHEKIGQVWLFLTVNIIQIKS